MEIKFSNQIRHDVIMLVNRQTDRQITRNEDEARDGQLVIQLDEYTYFETNTEINVVCCVGSVEIRIEI